jgi:small ligand-binding sensory domain FIST
MKWTSTASSQADLGQATKEVVARVRAELKEPIDLAVVFLSPHHSARCSEVIGALRSALRPRVLIGCSAGGVIGGAHEIEDGPGLSLTVAALPGVELAPFHVSDATASAAKGIPAPHAGVEAPGFVLLADPFTFDAEAFVQGLDATYPSSAKIGGLASGGRRPGENVLVLDDSVHRSGLVGVAMWGDVRLDTLVAQGCRPIGEPMFVTRSVENQIYALDGRPPLEVLQQLFESLDPRARELFRHSLFVGLVMREKSEVYRRGDFLIRNVAGLDADRGTLFVGARVAEGTIVQFHLRDADTSAEDLEQMLSSLAPEQRHGARGALLFSCLGRGRHLYGRVDHDTESFRRHLGEVPLGGFFCNGEIGPVHGTTFVHGYTSSFGLFRRSPR